VRCRIDQKEEIVQAKEGQRGFKQKVRDRMSRGKNVLGGELAVCGTEPMTGFFRDGCCNTGRDDAGLHVVCAEVTDEFLQFSAERGNDLITPIPEFGFPGLRNGDRWCLCVERWKEAYEANVAPPVILAATHISTLEFVSLDDLKAHALDA
jgi:uncharacterized protein (DUF2237 family)